MHGQPSSETDNYIPSSMTCGNVSEPIHKVNTDIARVLSTVKTVRFQDMIMHEKLDDMDTLFMDGKLNVK